MSARCVSFVISVLSCAGVALAQGQGFGQGPYGPGQGQGNPPLLASQPTSQPVTAGPLGMTTIHDLTGTLVDIIGGAGLGHPYFEFTAGTTTYNIKATPYKLLVSLKIPDLIGQTVRMIFAECRQGSYVALQLIAGSDVYVFRDESGIPAWRMWAVDRNPGSANGPPRVDTASIQTVTGIVENVGASLVSNRLRVQVRSRDQQLAWVSLGPESLLLDQGFELHVGDQVSIMLAVQAENRERVALQLQNPETGQMAMIRNMEGHQYRLQYE